MLRQIFMLQGGLITIIGGSIGIILGVALSLAQQYGGFITLNGDPSQMTITTYPVRVAPADIAVIFILIIVIAYIAALITRVFTRKFD